MPYQNVGIVARRERLGELAPSIVPFLTAYRDGIERYDADKPFAMTVIGKYAQENDPVVLDKTYDFYRHLGFTRSLTVSEPGLARHPRLSGRGSPGGEGRPAGAILRQPVPAAVALSGEEERRP